MFFCLFSVQIKEPAMIESSTIRGHSIDRAGGIYPDERSKNYCKEPGILPPFLTFYQVEKSLKRVLKSKVPNSRVSS